MTDSAFTFPDPYVDAAQKINLPVRIFTADAFKGWPDTQSVQTQARISQSGFEAKPGQSLILYTIDGLPETILIGVSTPVSHYDLCPAADVLKKNFSAAYLKDLSITLQAPNLTPDETERLCIGWGWAAYNFNQYKTTAPKSTPTPLVWPKSVAKDYVRAQVQSVCLLRDLVNTPSNDLGTEELEDAARRVAKHFKAKVSVIADKDLLKQNFPMIYAVGRGSPRRPRLVDITWGDAKAPKVTIVGKGVVFDTGGLDIKPPAFMTLMKKDMGGAAHALALAWMIMSSNLPIRLRVLLPIAENSVDGDSFRPGDVLTSRKGLTVEVGDTDAEGRLVLGDALTYGAEENPDLMINFATLTGAARIALGPDIPAILANRDETADTLKRLSFENEDPVWPLPMYQPYWKDYASKIADFGNDDNTRMAGAIKAGLFLQKFAGADIDWVHVDCYAWTNSDRPGRPFGGADTGFRAVFKLIEKKYA
jgi:leucyl aminopeptidase